MARRFKFPIRKKRDCTIFVAKQKAVSHEVAHIEFKGSDNIHELEDGLFHDCVLQSA